MFLTFAETENWSNFVTTNSSDAAGLGVADATEKIFIAVPAYGETFYTPCVQSLFKLAVELNRRKLHCNLAAASYADIAETRNVLLTHWFDKKDARILFVMRTWDLSRN